MEPTQLGPYHVTRKLGQGAMGAVYQAVHEEDGQVAAVKLLSSALSHDEGFRIRFESEIETLRKLRHPNIVRCYGFGEQDGNLFYAMELVDGVSLDQPLKEGDRFDWRQVVQIGVQICRALKHAHDRGVIHRDLKPANLIYTPEQQIKLADFGIARLYGHAGLTMAGGPIGTATYMSPEQTEGGDVSQRSDLYSLGCVFYALLSGRPPFQGSNLTQVLKMQQTADAAPISHFVPQVPPELELIIAKLLEKQPSDRIPTAATLSRSLQAVTDAVALRGGVARPDDTTPTTPPPSSRPTEHGPSTTIGRDAASRSQLAQQAADHSLQAKPAQPTRDRDDDATAPMDQPPSFSGTADTLDTKRDPPDTLRDGARERNDDAETRGSMFVTSEQADEIDRQLAAMQQPPRPHVISIGTIVFVVAAIALAVGLKLLTDPPSADEYFQRIERMVADDSEEAIERADDYIRKYEHLYADDPRMKAVAPIRTEARMLRLDRRLQNKAKRMLRIGADSPIERLYLEAVNHAQIDPDRGLVKFRALVDLFDDETGPHDKAGREYLMLAKRQIERLEQRIELYAAAHLRMLSSRLDHIERLAADKAEIGADACRAVIELYQDKPWAHEQVARAGRLLDQFEETDAGRSAEDNAVGEETDANGL